MFLSNFLFNLLVTIFFFYPRRDHFLAGLNALLDKCFLSIDFVGFLSPSSHLAFFVFPALDNKVWFLNHLKFGEQWSTEAVFLRLQRKKMQILYD